MQTPPPTEILSFKTEDDARPVTSALWRGGRHGLLLVDGMSGLPMRPWRSKLAQLIGHGLTVLEPRPEPMGTEAGAALERSVETISRMVAGGVAHLRGAGARAVSVLGIGRGAEAAAEAVLTGLVGNLDVLILVGPERVSGPVGRLTQRVIFVVCDDDDAMKVAVEQHMFAPDTTQLTLYTGETPAAALFDSPQHGRRLVKLITDALDADPWY